jgi:hypothetical protein
MVHYYCEDTDSEKIIHASATPHSSYIFRTEKLAGVKNQIVDTSQSRDK